MVAAVTFDLVVIWLNLIAAVGATAANVWAMTVSRWPYRWVFAVSAAMALVFAGGYVWLLGEFPERAQEWSQVMRGVSLLAWVLVWTMVPVVSTLASLRAHRALGEVEKVIEECPK